MYAVNLKRAPDRLDYMKRMFNKYMNQSDLELVPVNAVDFNDKEATARYLGVQPSKIRDHVSTLCEPNTSIAPLLTYFKALGIAYQQNREYAIVADDDVSFAFVPHWPESVHQLIEKLTAEDPDWEMVRLAYTIGEHAGNGSRTAYMVLQEWKSKYPNLPSTMKWYNNVTSFSTTTMASGSVYGTIATLFSRRAIARFAVELVNFNRPPSSNAADPGENFTSAFGPKHFALGGSCVIDRWFRRIQVNEYIATPPLFTYRLAEGSLGHRSGKNARINEHAHNHLRARAFAEQFVGESVELLHASPRMVPSFAWEIERASEKELSALVVQGQEAPRFSLFSFLKLFQQQCVIRFNSLLCEPRNYPALRDFRPSDYLKVF